MQNIVDSGKSWISNYPVNGVPSIRTCISNYITTVNDIDELIQELNEERENYRVEKLNTGANIKGAKIRCD